VQEYKLKTLTALVISLSGDKSVKVAIDYKVKHPKYGKYIRKRTKFGVHDERNECGVGDLVEIAQCRPISKSKSHRLIKVIKKAEEK
jgi:small subunit ribosomal protein S17